jgi:hypothetical protein
MAQEILDRFTGAVDALFRTWAGDRAACRSMACLLSHGGVRAVARTAGRQGGALQVRGNCRALQDDCRPRSPERASRFACPVVFLCRNCPGAEPSPSRLRSMMSHQVDHSSVSEASPERADGV